LFQFDKPNVLLLDSIFVLLIEQVEVTEVQYLRTLANAAHNTLKPEEPKSNPDD
jgi:hypothetical protein